MTIINVLYSECEAYISYILENKAINVCIENLHSSSTEIILLSLLSLKKIISTSKKADKEYKGLLEDGVSNEDLFFSEYGEKSFTSESIIHQISIEGCETLQTLMDHQSEKIRMLAEQLYDL